MEPVLKTIRRQDVFDHLGSEAVAGSAPKSCQPKLGIGVHRRSFQKTFLRMEKLTNERVVQFGLPFLNKCKFKAAKIGSTGKKRDWGPDEQILVFAPVAKGQFRLDEAVIGELVVLAGATVHPVEYMMKCRPNVELGLKIGDVCEAYVHTIGQEKKPGKRAGGIPV